MEQNIRLKWILNDKYKNTSEQSLIDFWIINDWGGIRGFKSNERNLKKIDAFKNQLYKRKLSVDCFQTISSLSKIASFMDPDNWVIYDSRVIYALNWLILTCEVKERVVHKYFPMPSGRNKIIVNFDMNTIINLFHIGAYEERSEWYRRQQVAYFEFCDFIKLSSKRIYGEDAKPFELEMLLFTLADKEIFNELKQQIKLTTITTTNDF